MSEAIQDIEENIEAMRPSGFFEKHDVVLGVADIPEIPYGTFGDLQADLVAGRATARLAPTTGVSSGAFSLFASPKDRKLVSVFSVSAFVAPIVGIGLAVFGSTWWWLVLVFIPFVVMRHTKAIYSKALFNAIGASEKAFCFAFCGYIITLEAPDGRIHFRGRDPL